MSSWLERPERTNTNPAKKFLEWKSNDKCFSYYDKDKKENVNVELPLQFVILEHYHTVKGWDDDSESGIFANEVWSIGTEELNVRSLKGGNIAKGIYKDIRERIRGAGGHYSRSIYAVTPDLEIINISLKGSGVASYSSFINDFGDHNFTKNWIKVTGAKEEKKGSVKYSTPIFEVGAEIKNVEAIRPFAQELQEYILSYLEPASNKRPASVVDKYKESKAEEVEEVDEMPF